MTKLPGILAVLTALVVAAAPASADFHLACTDDVFGAVAEVSVAAAGDILTVTGSVYCPGADAVRIDSVTLTREHLGPSVAAPTPVSCANCTTVLRTSGTLGAAPAGVYSAQMTFSAYDVHGGDWLGVRRTVRYAYATNGVLTRLPLG